MRRARLQRRPQRRARRTQLPQAKLSEATVIEIRRLYPKLTLAELGEAYGVTLQAISYVVRLETWRHVA